MNEFHDFVSLRCTESESLKYWNNVLILINLMFDLIRADRTGDWQLHLRTTRKLIPVFLIFDRINYAKWCALYLEDMLMLEQRAPEVYEQFMRGRFTVKRSFAPFTSVATDQALEKTINRSSKSTAGIIGITRKKETVAVWDITYHEFLSIVSYFKEVTYFSNDDDEFKVHHEFSKTDTAKSESAVSKILDYMEEKACNPFKAGSHVLRTIITDELVQPEISNEILNIFEKGITAYEICKDERLRKKTKALTETITKKSLIKTNKYKATKEKKTSLEKTQKIILIAIERKFPLTELLQYEFTDQNLFLFDSDGLFHKQDDESSLIRSKEEKVNNYNSELFESDRQTCLVVDVMLILRKIPWKDLHTFQELAKSFCASVLSRASLLITKRIDFVFDSYFKKSIKSWEHARRTKTEVIYYQNLSADRVLPAQEDKFWASSKNKVLLQTFLKDFILNDREKFANFDLIFSTIDESLSTCNVNCDLGMLQRMDIEEADLKLMLHVKHAVLQGYTNIYLISSDTDVIVLALYFFREFFENGLAV